MLAKFTIPSVLFTLLNGEYGGRIEECRASSCSRKVSLRFFLTKNKTTLFATIENNTDENHENREEKKKGGGQDWKTKKE